MRDIKIELATGELDLKDGVGLPLNFNASDVKELGKRNAPYSKTITLVGSKNNNKILGGLFDVNADFTFFNPNLKTEARITLNSSTVIEGFLRLKSINIANDTFVEGNNVEYECVISNKTVDFYGKIKDKDLSEIDLSQYDHTLTKANIVSSWSHGALDVYTYPLMYKNGNYYETGDFKPSIFEKAYLIRMAKEAGYSIKGALMDETTDEGLAFSKDIIPFNGESPEITLAEQLRRKFKASSGATQSIASGTISTTLWEGLAGSTGTYEENITNATNDSTGGNFDNGGNYDTVLNKWTVDRDGSYGIQAALTLEASFLAAANCSLNAFEEDFFGSDVQKTVGAKNDFTITAFLLVNGVVEGFGINTSGLEIPVNLTGGVTDTQTQSITINMPSVYLQATDEVTFKLVLNSKVFRDGFLGTQLNYTDDGTITGSIEDVDYDIDLTSTVIHNEVTSGVLTDGDDVVLSSFIPKNIKQSDVVDDIIKRYNAYLTPDPDNDNVLILETRDTYYDRGSVLDWTNKKDYSKKDSIKLLSELQNKTIHFTYKPDDKDEYNENYTEALQGDIYGEKKIEFNNEFVKGEKKIETPFSPTPLVYNKESSTAVAIIPSIKTTAPETNPRVLHYGGLINTFNGNAWSWRSTDGAGNNVDDFYTTYPYAGHYDDPINPTIDKNFEEVPFEYYSEKETNTYSNLYNNYWKNWVEQIDEGKLVTSYFNLNEVDIDFIRNNLNSKIFVRDSYYYINKIIDYDPLNKGVTKVELLKIKDGVVFVDNIEDIDQNEYNPNEGSEVLTVSDSVSESNGTTSNGSSNRIGYDSDNSAINGDENSIGNNSPNSIIIGDDNRIDSEVTNGFIIGSNEKSITVSNTGYIGNQFYRNGLPASELEEYEVADVIALRDAGTLIAGTSYYCVDLGLSFKAESVDSLNFNTTRILEVPEASLYGSLGIWVENADYSIDDKIIWGGRVWVCTATGGGYTPTDDYTLNSSYYEVSTSAADYDKIVVDVIYSESEGQVITTLGGEGNVVNSTDENLHLFSDWNDSRIFNNNCHGFINNEVEELSNNICKIIKNNRNYGTITGNRNNGNIIENTSQASTTFSITDNANNGSIDFNHSTANITINNNINNGYIGTTSVTNRASSLSDTTVNK